MSRLLTAAIAALAVSVIVPAGVAQTPVRFTDVTRESGVSFRHVNGASPDKHLVETMGSGGLFFDYDNDGWIDLFLVDGGSLADARVASQAKHRLYRNRRNGTFEDVTPRSGIQHREYGMGACAGDYDNDGWIDLYVTNFGPNVLYRNRGDGSFTDVTTAAHVGFPSWSASCAFADLDKDGDLDLFVVNYVDADRRKTPYCGNAKLGQRFYCHPLNYPSLPNTLYRNDGRVFTDVSSASGIGAYRGNGLGVVVTDYDGDGWPDVFVANDSVANFLFRNTGKLRFVEAALGAGVAVASDGKTRAGMGVDAGDYDGDGREDLVVTNLDFETHSLFRNLGDGLFGYATRESGLGFATLPFVGFGVVFMDADNDAQLDVAIANGHIMDNAPLFRSGTVYNQRNLLFRNSGSRRFIEIGLHAGDGFALEKVSRGLASGDIDNDGDLDLLVTNNGQTADLLRNDTVSGNSLLVRALARTSPSTALRAGNHDAVGARVRVTAGGRTQVREMRAGSSYLGQNDLRLHFGLGDAATVDRVEVTWPSGRVEVLTNVRANHIVTIQEGRGVVRRVPFTR
jgi:enediyne biosynthesis protein E4